MLALSANLMQTIHGKGQSGAPVYSTSIFCLIKLVKSKYEKKKNGSKYNWKLILKT